METRIRDAKRRLKERGVPVDWHPPSPYFTIRPKAYTGQMSFEGLATKIGESKARIAAKRANASSSTLPLDQLPVDIVNKIASNLVGHADNRIGWLHQPMGHQFYLMEKWREFDPPLARDRRASFDYVNTEEGTREFLETLSRGAPRRPRDSEVVRRITWDRYAQLLKKKGKKLGYNIDLLYDQYAEGEPIWDLNNDEDEPLLGTTWTRRHPGQIRIGNGTAFDLRRVSRALHTALPESQLYPPPYVNHV